MPFYLLAPVPNADDPTLYDTATGFVVHADTIAAAREIAARNCGDEGTLFWHNIEKTSCIDLERLRYDGVLLRSFRAG